jgi:enoyl-CoA hydratase/carnithine racemase
MTTDNDVDYAVAAGVATLTLNRPARMNALTRAMEHSIVDLLDEADADDTVRVLIVTGSGRAFCAGADLGGRGGRTFDTTDAEQSAVRAAAGTIGGFPRDGGGMVSLRMAGFRKPIIGAINGAAVGLGATMTLPMDIRIAAESARFGFVFARRGIVMEAASSWFLPRIVGISQAMEWIATGRVFGSSEALTGRLVSRVVPDDQLIIAAHSIAREIADNTSSVSVAVSRQLLWSMLGAESPWTAHLYESKALAHLGGSPDATEGVTSFLEKRPPQFPAALSTQYPDAVPVWPTRPEGI